MEKIPHYLFPKSQILFKLIHGYLERQGTEAIVNAANNKLKLGSGVAAAILKEAGEEIQKECDELVKEKGEIPTGNVVYTGRGKFVNKHLKFIFHAVGPIYKDGTKNEAEELKNAFKNSFLLAEELKLSSLALPAISSGIFGYPKDECANIFYETFIDFVDNRKEGSLKEIRMVILDDVTFNVFLTVQNEVFNKYEEKFGGIVNNSESNLGKDECGNQVENTSN